MNVKSLSDRSQHQAAQRGRSRPRAVFGRAVVCLLVVLALAGPALAADEPARISNVIVRAEGLFLLVDFHLDNAFSEKIDEGVLSGLPTTFTFVIQLARERSTWADEQLASIEVKRTISYDSLKQEFSVSPGDGGDRTVTKDIQRAHELMSRVQDVPLAVRTTLLPNERYYVEVKADLRSVELPPFLDSLLFFVSFWDVQTEWTRVYLDPELWESK